VEPVAATPRPFALVTGACSGIGLAIAGRLAARGWGIVAVSERADRLAGAASRLRERHGVPVREIVVDLGRPGAALEVAGRIRELGVEVDVLVNNAGIFFFGEAVDADPARAEALLHLHVVTPSLLCTLVGREMRARGRGRILLVSSISAWRDFPGIAYYGASKRYLRGFARSIRSELGPQGVTVTCLAPGPVDTALYPPDAAPVARGRRLGLFLSPDVVAEAAVRALLAGRAECIPGVPARLMAWGSALTPQWIVDLLRRRAPWLRQGGTR
jgi:hypothetical protein